MVPTSAQILRYILGWFDGHGPGHSIRVNDLAAQMRQLMNWEGADFGEEVRFDSAMQEALDFCTRQGLLVVVGNSVTRGPNWDRSAATGAEMRATPEDALAKIVAVLKSKFQNHWASLYDVSSIARMSVEEAMPGVDLGVQRGRLEMERWRTPTDPISNRLR